MRVLLDECTPEQLRRHLPGHEVRTVREMGWLGLKNGALIAAMIAGGFEVLLTVDKSIPYQQNAASLPISLIIMSARRNSLPKLLPLVPGILSALQTIQPGRVAIVKAT